ncbi:zinc-binding alcohol dehydrogenase family protein [Schinkia azotoformans]|uniref:zinc-binding alcohol dehydrogenase family protein n=1 Tax=Schinkia azotoformans TaxID=1454 RepID=UPI002DBE0485|nr:zinc-binding alcohol dehydrogenase family protein [Schinkia azotoformans]MEC1720372.1 zinc-binding alcohol dehydrogenase family protein [Schinkia azotoformans]MED4353810.1 zinc-binding alcohol dehydrogenase family protein [Schinkia azotoformans]MED4413375.1 zinc-binding alcohol dehydrogenase family protein [Schinkia azotoformans]
MKTIVCQQPGEMKMIEQERPSVIADNEVLVAVKRIGICGTDIHAYGGNQPFFAYPRVLGHELSAVVERVGAHVTKVEAGDLISVIPYMHCGECISCKNGKTNCCTNMKVLGVHIDGGMTEHLVLPESHVFKVNELSLEEAAVIEPLCIGAHAVRRADIREGETVLIVGAGPIGMGAARFAKLQGAKTIIMDINEERLQACKEWAGCDFAVKASDAAVEELKAVNDGWLPTVVMDATGNKFSMTNAFDYVCHGGKVVYVGLVKDTITFNDPDFHAKELTLMGSRNATKEDFEYVIQSVKDGKVNAASYITHKINFDDAVSYFEAKSFNTNKALIVLE